MHHGFYEPGSAAASDSDHRLAQIRMIEESLRFAGVSGSSVFFFFFFSPRKCFKREKIKIYLEKKYFVRRHHYFLFQTFMLSQMMKIRSRREWWMWDVGSEGAPGTWLGSMGQVVWGLLSVQSKFRGLKLLLPPKVWLTRCVSSLLVFSSFISVLFNLYRLVVHHLVVNLFVVNPAIIVITDNIAHILCDSIVFLHPWERQLKILLSLKRGYIGGYL